MSDIKMNGKDKLKENQFYLQDRLIISYTIPLSQDVSFNA